MNEPLTEIIDILNTENSVFAPCQPRQQDETVLNYLTSASVYDDDSLSLASYECQSPDFSPDKEHHKTLKSERPQWWFRTFIVWKDKERLIYFPSRDHVWKYRSGTALGL